jgi:cardiolipin synthase
VPFPSGRDRFDQARLINIANVLTAMRVLLVPLFAWLLIVGKEREALAVFVVCGLTDALDGVLARWLKQRTLVGAYLDPIADKLLMATAFIVLAYVRIVPRWLAILVISRDIFILVGSFLYLLLLDPTDIRPTLLSKVNTAAQIVAVSYFLATAAFPEVAAVARAGDGSTLSRAVILLCAATTAGSGVQYLFLGLRKLSDV